MFHTPGLINPYKHFYSQLLKTPRNILIANIALSDILLCVFTMPLSLLDMIHNYWPLGSGQVSPT